MAPAEKKKRNVVSRNGDTAASSLCQLFHFSLLYFFKWSDAKGEFFDTLGAEGYRSERSFHFNDDAVSESGMRDGIARAEGVG